MTLVDSMGFTVFGYVDLTKLILDCSEVKQLKLLANKYGGTFHTSPMLFSYHS
jgi:hypothetical protein